MTGDGWPMPWAYAVQFVGRVGPGLALPKCFFISSDVPGDSGDNLRWDGVFVGGGLSLSITFVGSNVSEGTDPDFGPWRRNQMDWTFFESNSGNTGTGGRLVQFFRGDTDPSGFAITWTGVPLFSSVNANCLAWNGVVEDRAVCQP